MKKKIINTAANFTVTALILGMLFWRIILYRQWGYLLYSKGFAIMASLWIGFVSLLFSLILAKVKNDQAYALKSRALWQPPLVFLFGLTGFFFLSSFILKTLLGPDFWSLLSSLPTQCAVKIPFLSLIILFPGTLFLFLFIFIHQIRNMKLKMEIRKAVGGNEEKNFSHLLITLVVTCIFVFTALMLPDRIHFYFSAMSYQKISNDADTREYLENFIKYYSDSKLADPVRFMLSRVLIRTFNMPWKACEIIKPLIDKKSSPFRDDALFEYAYIKCYEMGETREAEQLFTSFLSKYPENPLKNNVLSILAGLTGKTSKYTSEYKKLRDEGAVIYEFGSDSGIIGMGNIR